MDPLHLCVALAPLAIYLMFIAFVNLRTRPSMLGGLKDASLLALGISGLVVAGPLELFLPESAAFRFGAYVWLLLIVLYFLAAALIILSQRPRIVVYNTTAEELRPIISTIVQQLDDTARWAGDSVALPKLGVQLHLDRSPTLRNVQLISTGATQNFDGWIQVEKMLKKHLSEIRTRPGRQGSALLVAGMLMLFIVGMALVVDRESIAQSLQEMLRM